MSPPRPRQLGTGPHAGPAGTVGTPAVPSLPGEGRRFLQDTLPWWPQGSLPRTAAADRSGSVSLTPAPPPGVSPQEMKEAALVSSRDIMQIDLDVNRTFRSHTMFWDRYGVG